MAQYIVTENSITVLIKNRPEIIDNSHPNFELVEQAIKEKASEDRILELINTGKAIVNFANKTEITRGNVEIKDGEVLYMGEPVHGALVTRIISLMNNGFDITPFTNFMENLYENPSYRAVTELYGFLEACNLPITEDGYFLAYKKIKYNYTDCYTGKIDNSIGVTVSMPRFKVNEDKNQTCSAGLHVASYSYMSSYHGDRIVICKVNPKNVVAVPTDYNNAKMRVCEYQVINEVDIKDEQIPENVISNNEAYSDDYDEYPDDTYDESFEYYNDDEASCDTEMINVNSEFVEVTKSPLYADCESMLADIDLYDLEDCRLTFGYIPEAFNFLQGVKPSTSFWKRNLIDILHTHYGFDCPADEESNGFYKSSKTSKMKFGIALEEFLKDYNLTKWNRLTNYMSNQGLDSVNGLISTSFSLKDYRTVITKLKSLAKDGQFKKKHLLKSLGI